MDFEHHFKYIGCLALEEDLQKNVKQCVLDFKSANIKFALATGDDLEISKCVSHAAGFFNENDEIIELDRINIASFIMKEKSNNKTYAVVLNGPEFEYLYYNSRQLEDLL